MGRHLSKTSAARISFANTRTRFQRLEDAKLFNGWVNALTSKNVVINLSSPLAAEPGQNFRFEIYGTGAIAVFKARLEIASGAMAVFALTTSIRTMPSFEEMRLRTKELIAKIYLLPRQVLSSGIKDLDDLTNTPSQNAIAEGSIIDISSKGLGVLVPTRLEKGMLVRAVMETPWGSTEAVAEVCYCKKDGERYRLGLEISEMDRLHKGLYDRLIRYSAAA